MGATRRSGMGATRRSGLRAGLRAAGALTAGLTAVALAALGLGWAAAGAVEAGLQARVSGGLNAAGHRWVEVRVDGARVSLSGMAPDAGAAADALRVAAQASGPFASLEDGVAAAPPLSARFEAAVAAAAPAQSLEILRDGDGAAILGVAPDAMALRRIVARLSRLIGAPVDASLARARESGDPWPHWAEIERAGVAAAAATPLGRVTLAPGRLSVSTPGPGADEGRPDSGKALADALERLKDSGVEVSIEEAALGPLRAEPGAAAAGPRLSPEAPAPDATWLAISSHPGGVALSGAAPDAASRMAIASYAAAAFVGRPLDSDGFLAPGEPAPGEVEAREAVPASAPDGWRAAALAAVDALSRLEGGAARVGDGAASLRGRTLEAAAAREADAALAPLRERGWTAETRVTVDLAARAAAMRLGAPACAAAMAEQAAADPILFAPGESVLAADASPALDALAAILPRCEGGVVEVGGHTDSQGSADYNLALSASRAEAVAAALAERVALRVALSAKGYGPTRPIADNDTEEGRARNRRIAFTAPVAAVSEPETETSRSAAGEGRP
ncbi:OmpA family protein [Rubrimonas cliftonensis]|uniref:OmpA family protein n=1 Tax=Rubrimonas cliftonensis TaxID=89524 RepID=A0A1H4F777_9RHOB|nr:OmpA family protein [Rubrimonas cliftonensis]SEA93143.1 OmpA family protein [Rubrimonas cliftonensis]